MEKEYQHSRDRSLFTGGGGGGGRVGPLYLGGGSLFFELHFGEDHVYKLKFIEGRATCF